VAGGVGIGDVARQHLLPAVQPAEAGFGEFDRLRAALFGRSMASIFRRLS
jgi:hypothetical protein